MKKTEQGASLSWRLARSLYSLIQHSELQQVCKPVKALLLVFSYLREHIL